MGQANSTVCSTYNTGMYTDATILIRLRMGFGGGILVPQRLRVWGITCRPNYIS